ncbi:MAG: hypothetical protein ABII72_01755 [Parcubacteria group bacterium]
MLVETVAGQIRQVIGKVYFRSNCNDYRLVGKYEIPGVIAELSVKDMTIYTCCQRVNPSPVPCLYIWKIKVDLAKEGRCKSEGGSYQLIPLKCWQLRFAAKYGDSSSQFAGQFKRAADRSAA